MSLQAKVLVFVFVAFTLANAAPFPLEDTVQQALANIATLPDPTPTGLTKANYLQSIAGVTNYFRRNLQNSAGLIIDPYQNREIQYATPTFAHAAIVQGLTQRDDAIVQAGVKALNVSLTNLVNKACADGHCNFFTMPIMAAIEVLRPSISVSLWQYYMTQAAKISTSAYTNNDINWGIVAAGGEFMRYQYGLTDLTWLNGRISFHLGLMSDNGLYMDPTPASNPSTAYDLFPRLYLEQLVYRGYNGTYASILSDLLSRAAKTSLLMQSPKGEWPTGGRSSQHMWNDAVMCALFEMRASIHWQSGEVTLAKAFKRAARLAHQSFQRYISEFGYHFVLKNKMDPSLRWGYETYSYLTNYNGLPVSMLALAYQVADDSIPEGPSFAETGGYVFYLKSHNKIIANVRGSYYEWESRSDLSYDSTGLTRIHNVLNPTLIGPSAGPAASAGGMTVGLGWTKGGVSESLAQFGYGTMGDTSINVSTSTATHLEFDITYAITASAVGVTQVVEKISIVSNKITVTTSLNGDVDSVQFRYPIFLTDGDHTTDFSVVDNKVIINEGATQTYSVVSPAGVTLTRDSSVQVVTRNGYMGLVSGSVPNTQSEYVFTLTQGGPEVETVTFIVGRCAAADYKTIGQALAAVASLGANYVLKIEEGVYAERVTISTPNGVLRALGEVVILSSVSNGAVVDIQASNVKLYGITVANTLPQGSGSGIALSVSGAQVSVYDSSFLSFTNTLSFASSASAYFKGSYIEGAVDVVSGSGKVLFDEVILASNAPGALTAQNGVSASNSDVFVFNYVELVATAPSPLIASSSSSAAFTSNQVQGQNYLGRPVGSFSRVVFTFSNIGSHIKNAGWAQDGLLFGEFENTGPSGTFGLNRVGGVFLSGDDAKAFTLAALFGNSAPAWIDPAYLPTCGAVFTQCGGTGFSGPRCCRAPYSCVEQSANISQCIYVPLSPRGDGSGQLFNSGTIALNTIFVTNPLGEVKYTLETTDLTAKYVAEYKNAVLESVISTVTYQISPIPAINVTLAYSPNSDPRNIEVDLHIKLPIGSRVKVVTL